MRHIFFLLSFLVMIVACNGDTSESQSVREVTSTSSPKTTVNWMGHWLTEDLRETLVREVATEFGFKNPDIEVNLQFPQEIIGERSKVLTAEFIAEMIQNNQYDWDIVWMDVAIYQTVAQILDDPFWGEKYLVDFSQVDGFAATQKPFIINDADYKAQTGGILVGPYIEGYYYSIYYNKALADQVGLEVKTENMTADDLLGYAEQVYNYNQSHSTSIATFYEAADWTTLEILFQNLFNSKLNNFEEAKGEAYSPNKEVALLTTFQFFEELGQYDPLIVSHQENTWFETRDLILRDEVLFYVNGTWMYSHWHSLDPEAMSKIVPAELPVFAPVDYYLGGYIPTFAVMKDAPHRDEAIRLLMYWSRPEVAEQWVDYTRNPTGILGNVASSGIGSDLFEIFQASITNRYGERVHYDGTGAYALGLNNTLLKPELDQLILALLEGQITAQAAFNQISAEMGE